MINRVYQLISPKIFEIYFQEISLLSENVLVRPTFLSICAADQRYYQGKRSKKSLGEKLPMALIHEAVGVIVNDNTNTFTKGTSVVLIPNTPMIQDQYISENYLSSSKFKSSNLDGFMQEYVEMDPDRLVNCTGIDPLVASVIELLSVSMHATHTFLRESHNRRNTIGIWGDGNLAYMLALVLLYESPHSKIIIIGADTYKLSYFSFVDRIELFNQLPDTLQIDHAFECVGGQNATEAINQIIERISPEGTITLMGVSEENISLPTRLVLEKGLRLCGRSRSGKADFIHVIDLLRQHTEIQQRIKKILSNTISVSTINDIPKAFEEDMKTPFKTVIEWKI